MDIEKAIKDLKEMKSIEYRPEHKVKVIETVLEELDKKDKIIDEMAKQLYIEGFCREIKCVECTKEPKECIKQYFEKKVEERSC